MSISRSQNDREDELHLAREKELEKLRATIAELRGHATQHEATITALDELKDLLGSWARKHVPIKFWLAAGDAEQIEPSPSESDGGRDAG